jgi:transposase InsO family protein
MTVGTHGARCGIGALCVGLGLAPATYYRARHARPRRVGPRPPSPRALHPTERAHVLTVLHEARFVDLAPAQVYATLLDEGTYHCSERTMYRVLAAQAEVRERRAQRRHPHYAAPELLATAPNQRWSWDITKLKGPVTWSSYHLYVVLDVFSRYVVGWMIAPRESRGARRTAHHRVLRAAAHRARTAYHPRRPRVVDDVKTRGALARRSRRHENPLAPARVE